MKTDEDLTLDERNIILTGQMCYDELSPQENVIEEEKENFVVVGQISMQELEKFKVPIYEKRIIKKINIKKSKNIIQQKIEIVENKMERKLDKKKEQSSFNNEPPKGIITRSLDEVMHDSMIPYTEHVVMDRALPRVEDGLKPVQRRILYSMLELGLTPDKQYRKSARIVGDCMGKYHPHGDSSVYDAMVRMAQDYSLRATLVDGHGNFGSIDGDSAAAMRYTEAKLTPLALELLKDLEKDTVHWSFNFDDTLKEPDMLPGRFPNLLVNGASGIAVGVATNIPPHNLGEVIDAVVSYIDNPKIDLKGLMKHIKAPDFPTGGEIIIDEDLENAYRTGKGKIIIRAKVSIEESGDKQNLIITEIPYQTNKALLLQKIAELKEQNKDRLSAISEIRDESDRNGMRAVIRIKKEGNAKAILDFLFKATSLQVSFGINMVAIAGGKPKLMGLLEIISYYVEYQREVVYRRTKFDLDACLERAHILEGLLIAIKNIDEVIKIIKKSATVTDAKQKLRERFKLSDKQAQAILDMRLARLVNLEITKIEEELAELKKRIEQLTAIYNSKKLQLNVVKEEILSIKKQYKSERRSKILKSSQIEEIEQISEESFVKEIMIATNIAGCIKSVPIKSYNLAIRNITDSTSTYDIHNTVIKAKSNNKILIFTNLGNCLKIEAGKIPEGKWRDKGVTLNSLDKNIQVDEFAVSTYLLDKETEEEYLSKEFICFTKQGFVKRSLITEYLISKNCYQAVKLKEGDEVVAFEEFNAKFNILMCSKLGMALHFDNKDITTMGRVSSGVRGINLDDGDYVIYAGQIAKSGAITTISEKGFVKNVPIGEFEVGVRYRKGLRIIPVKEVGTLMLAKFSNVAPMLAVKLDNKFVEVLGKSIVYDNRVGKGKQVIKQKIKNVYLYLD